MGDQNPNAGRHSLDTRDQEEALRLLPELDQSRAIELGLAPLLNRATTETAPLPLEDGRRLYESYVARPRVTGGVRPSTAKRYRAVFDKFVPFAKGRGISVWNGVNIDLLTSYAAHLDEKHYAYKTLRNELITIKQAVRWLVQVGHLCRTSALELKLHKAECDRAYCWRPLEVQAIVEHCRSRDDLRWLADVVVALACTGLRISELVALRWSDLDLTKERLSLTDETGRRIPSDRKRRQLKSGRSRSFPIHQALITALEQIDRRDGFVFHGPRGGRLKADTVRRVLVRDVLEPLAEQFPPLDDEKGFRDGRLHSFRHYFCSTCANSGVPEQMVMAWLGHQDSEMVRHYYHLHDDEARRRMAKLDFVGDVSGPSANAKINPQFPKEDVGPIKPERSSAT
jgi:integrase